MGAQLDYLGPNWEQLRTLADATILLEDGTALPVNCSDLARQSAVLCEAIVAHRQEGAGPVVLSAPFQGQSLAAVTLFLRCIYRPQDTRIFLAAALRTDPSGAAVQGALRLAHITEAAEVRAAALAHLETVMPQLELRASFIPWLLVAEECEADGLWDRLVRRVVKELVDERAMGSTQAGAGGTAARRGQSGARGGSLVARHFLEGAASLHPETVLAILTGSLDTLHARCQAGVERTRVAAKAQIARLRERVEAQERRAQRLSQSLNEARRQHEVVQLRPSRRSIKLEWTQAFIDGVNYFQSPTFQVDNLDWRVKVYPSGAESDESSSSDQETEDRSESDESLEGQGEPGEFVSIYLYLESASVEVDARWSMTWVNWDDPARGQSVGGRDLFTINDGFGSPDLIRRSDVLDEQQGYLNDGVATIRVEIEVLN